MTAEQVIERAKHKAHMEVAAIEIDGFADEVAHFMARYPGMPEESLRGLVRVLAEMEQIRSRLIEAAQA